MHRIFSRKSLAIVLLCSLIWTPAAVAVVARDEQQNRLCGRIEVLSGTGQINIQGELVTAGSLIPELYRRNGYDLIWRRERNMSDLLEMIQSSLEEGLTPADYHQAALIRMLQRYQAGAVSGCERADLDLLLTDALLRLGYHLLYGKVNPRNLDPDWNLKREIYDRDPVELMQSAIESVSLRGFLQQFTPVLPLYSEMKRVLADYRAIAAHGGWPRIPPGPTLRPGDRDPRVTLIRRYLSISGDLEERSDTDQPVYDRALEQAVVRFQKRHALEMDGAIGRRTLAAMNVPVAARIDQIRVNMERSRWVFRDVPDEFLMIDIAGFQAALYRSRKPVWEAAVQVGTPFRKTPVFQGLLEYLVFNPTWTVPPTIFEQDILPILKKDPGYLQEKNMRVIDAQGNSVDVSTIDWQRVSHRDFPFLLRQDPGPHNALGRIKFMFPNKHSVYLHDTPNQSGFRQRKRTFSSGCIRVERPLELAELLLNDPLNWSREMIEQAIATAETRTVRLNKRIPVLLLYWTVGADDANFYFKPDVYQRDGEVLNALNGEFRFDPPDNMPAWYHYGLLPAQEGDIGDKRESSGVRGSPGTARSERAEERLRTDR